MRGTLLRTLTNPLIYRITPAYAGNTLQARAREEQPWDHPRVCGEHTASLRLLCVVRGSPPRMRGTLEGDYKVGDEIGITPAYAGNTS